VKLDEVVAHNEQLQEQLKAKSDEVELHKESKIELKERLAESEKQEVREGYSLQALEAIGQLEAQNKYKDIENMELSQEVVNIR